MLIKCNNLSQQKHSLHDRESHFDRGVAVKVAHVVANLEHVHKQTEQAK